MDQKTLKIEATTDQIAELQRGDIAKLEVIEDNTDFDAQMRKEAMDMLAEEDAPRFGSISLRGGVLSLDDVAQPDNSLLVVIVAKVFERACYKDKFNPDVQTKAQCYALARVNDDTLAPEPTAQDPQAPLCSICANNKFKSADNGKGKKCRESRKLAVLPAGYHNPTTQKWEMLDDAMIFMNQPAILRLPVTSLPGFGNYLRYIASVVQRPYYAVKTLVKTVPDVESTFKVQFSFAGLIEDKTIVAAIQSSNENITAALLQPYKNEEE